LCNFDALELLLATAVVLRLHYLIKRAISWYHSLSSSVLVNVSPSSLSLGVVSPVSYYFSVLFPFCPYSLIRKGIHGIHLAAALRVNATVTNLDLSDNLLRSLGIRALLDALVTHPSITHLSILQKLLLGLTFFYSLLDNVRYF
jgi:hypothetical protein